MDTKITLSFDKDIIKAAKKYAEDQNISLSRLTEFLYRQITSGSYQSIEDFPIADWVNEVSEGEAEYKTKKVRNLKAEYYESKRK